MTDKTAIQLVYLVAGVDSVRHAHRVKVHLTGSEDHPISAGGGHIGMVSDLVPFAQLVAYYIKANTQNFPGVFEYEATESLGVWLAKNWDDNQPMAELFAAELKRQGDIFFAK